MARPWKSRMTLKDYIGKRGEKIFSVLITKFCGGKPLFDETFLGIVDPKNWTIG